MTEYDPETEIRLQLREAIKENDLEEVAAAVRDFKNMKLVDIDGDLIRGERLLGLNECLQGRQAKWHLPSYFFTKNLLKR